MNKILITLCARGGSKGIPQKNTKLLAGKPLIAYSIDVAKQFAANVSGDVTVALSTDADYVREVALSYGLVTAYRRPSFLATDAVGKIPVWEHLLEFEEIKSNCRFNYLVDLDISSPLRTVDDLLNGYKNIENDPNALTLYSVSKSEKNPYFNMVEPNGAGYYQLVKNSECVSRQTAPPVYSMNASFYFIRREFFDLREKTIVNNKSLIYCMDHLCFDLDEMLDFDFLEYLISNKKVAFIESVL